MSTLRTLLAPITALALLGAACGSSGDDGGEPPGDQDELGAESSEATSPPATDAPADSEAEAVLRIGVQVTSVDFTTGVAVITNNGDRDVDLSGWWICNRPNYAELPQRTLAPGDSVEASLGGFSAEAGEVAIYSDDAFGDATKIQAYVGWGDGGGRQSVAEEAGIWSGGPVQPAGDTIELTGDAGSAAGWS